MVATSIILGKYGSRTYDMQKDVIYTGIYNTKINRRDESGHFTLKIKGENVQVCNDYIKKLTNMRIRDLKAADKPRASGVKVNVNQLRLDIASGMDVSVIARKHGVNKNRVHNEKRNVV